jgi:hypothetical protein
MRQNDNKKWFLLPLLTALIFTLNAQEIYTLRKYDTLETPDTIRRFATVSFGLNVGYYKNTSTVTDWLEGSYATEPITNIGISLKLNLGKKLSIGTGFNAYRLRLASENNLTVTTEASSTIASEPNFLLTSQMSIRLDYNIIEIPFEVSYKFNTFKKRWIPMVSIGTAYTLYGAPYLSQNVFSKNTFINRPSGSLPAERFVLDMDRPNFNFANQTRTNPFITVGLIYALSPHSFVRINGKFATQQNVGNSTLQARSFDLIKQSTIKTTQIGAFMEYFIVF